jgi:hypothetical protein
MSTKSVAEKLLIRPNSALWTSDAARLDRIGPLPEGVSRVDGFADATTALVFADDAASARAILSEQGDALKRPEVFWVAYPKANRSDINRDSLWPILAEFGMRPISQVAIDDVWSALRFRALKEGEPPFTGGQ